jgi:hypothetical protein
VTRPLILTIAAALAVAACAAPAPPAGSPAAPASASPAVLATPTPDLSTSCTGEAASGEARRFPGWPPDETFELVPIPVSTELAVGPNRVLLNLIDNQNNQLASPEREVEMRFYNLAADPATPAVTAQADYLPTTESLPGLYRAAPVELSCWGDWGLEAVTSEQDGSERTGRMIFSVRATTTTPAIGAQAPASDTPTADTTEEIATISTDTSPDPSFYEISVEQAVAEGQPFLLIFSTPAFCATRTCGPALDIVKAASEAYRGRVAFIHVEPYQLQLVGGNAQLALDERNQPIVVEAAGEWGLPTEPYIFVVDGEGHVAAKMEGVASQEEIEAALRQVAN